MAVDAFHESARGARRAFYRPELDALRFFAFLAVFTRHTISNKLEWWQELGLGDTVAHVGTCVSQAGAFGVYLFYALSAYLITILLLREKAEHGRLHVKQFYLRRALRIWPLYFAFLVIGSLCALVTGEPTTWKELPYFAFFAGNWAVIAHGALSRSMNQLWSVSVEEQFYILWPVTVAKLERTQLAWIASAMIVLPIATIPLGPGGWDYAFMSTISGFSAMGAGVLLACVCGERTETPPVPRWLLVIAGLGCWYAAAALHIGESAHRSIIGVLLVDAGSIALLLAFLGASVRGALVYLGKISYGLYVFHGLVIALVDTALPRQTVGLVAYPAIVLVELAGTIALAAMSYRWLEAPFLRLKERFAFVQSRPV